MPISSGRVLRTRDMVCSILPRSLRDSRIGGSSMPDAPRLEPSRALTTSAMLNPLSIALRTFWEPDSTPIQTSHIQHA